MGRRKCAIVSCCEDNFNSNLSFHKFPVNPKMRKMWLKATNLPQQEIKRSTTVCAKHFKACDYLPSAQGVRKLTKQAVPKLCLLTTTSGKQPKLSLSTTASGKQLKTKKTVVKQTKKETEGRRNGGIDKTRINTKNVINTRVLQNHHKLEKRKLSNNHDSAPKKFKPNTGENIKLERIQNQKKSQTNEVPQDESTCDMSSLNKRYWSSIQETITEMQEKIKSLESKSIQDGQKYENFLKLVMQQRKEEIEALIQERENELIMRMDGHYLDYDLKRICRLCLLENAGPLIPLFQPNRENLIKKIQRWTGIQVEREDGMPNNICYKCSIEMEKADWFQKRSEKANALLKKIIQMKKAANTMREIHPPIPFFEEENSFYTNQTEQVQNIKIEIEDVFSLANTVEQNFEVCVKEEIEDTDFFEAIDIFKKTKNTDEPDLTQQNFYPSKKYCMKCNMHSNNCLNKEAHCIQCNECGKCFWNRLALKKHMLLRIECFVPLHKRTCNICNMEFRWRWQLNIHFWQHRNRKFHACMICGEQFANLLQLKTHVTSHF